MFKKIPKNVKKMFKVMMFFALSSFIIINLFFRVSRDNSLPYTFWFKMPQNKEVYEIGDYLSFNLGYRDKFLGTRNLVKEIKCIPGQKLQRIDKDFYCDNIKLNAHVLDKTYYGADLPTWEYNGIIPENYYFMLGTNPRSYDSRYFGLINKDKFINYLYPVRKLIKEDIF